jgi:Domain of unknown function DUF11
MILAALVLAAAADVGVVSVTPSKTEVRYDETFTLTARVRNFGPDAASGAYAILGSNAPGVVLTVSAPAGWLCIDPGREFVTCNLESMPAGAEAEFAITLTAPQPTPIAYRVGATAGSTGDANPANEIVQVAMPLLHPDRQSDVGVTVALETNPVVEGGTVRAAVNVRNEGPDAARDLVVAVVQDGPMPLEASGPGWSCTLFRINMLCRRAELAAGAAAPINLRATAPPRETRVPLSFRVRAETNYDPENGNNLQRVTLSVGSAANWERVLFPIVASVIPGPGGAAWTTEIGALIRDDEVPDFAPRPCEVFQVPCFSEPPPLRRQFDAFEHLLVPQDRIGGQYFYTRPEDARKFRFNARIYDDARVERTAGAEVPVVRDADFTSDVIALLNIPVLPQYRHTLRIYDADARDGALVRIRIYRGGETEPRVDTVRALRTLVQRTTTTALLPTHPAYAQEELSQLLPLEGLEPLRVEIEPVTPGVRLWAFVSVTNNDTHHVTVVTPQ